MFWLICNPNIFLSLSPPSPSPPPHWCVSQGTQGRCLTEPWMLFSCHAFPKRLAAAPIVAAEGGLLSWFFRPPAVALLSDGFIERECGPNNGRCHDIMFLVRTKSLHWYTVGFHCMERNRMCTKIFQHARRSNLPQLCLSSTINVVLDLLVGQNLGSGTFL